MLENTEMTNNSLIILQTELSNISSTLVQDSKALQTVISSNIMLIHKIDTSLHIANWVWAFCTIAITVTLGLSFHRLFSNQKEKNNLKKEISNELIKSVTAKYDSMLDGLVSEYKKKMDSIFSEYIENKINNQENNITDDKININTVNSEPHRKAELENIDEDFS